MTSDLATGHSSKKIIPLTSSAVSPISGSSDKTVHHQHFDQATAVTACDIACLGMLFHDQHCRETLVEANVKPIPFSYLPYAAVLMFVDALQDDRRDVSKSRFRAHGVLDSLTVNLTSGIVTAQADLRNLPVSQWPYRIMEYHSVMNWINGTSDIKFIVIYSR